MSAHGTAEAIGDSPRDPALDDAWRRLAELRSNPFSTPEWFDAALAANEEERPFPIVWRRDGEVRGVLPLVAVRQGPFRILRAAGARRADWFTPACAVADEAAMGAAVGALLRRERGAWQALRLDRLDLASAWPRALDGELAVGPRVREDVLPYVEFDEGGYEAYLAGRSRNFRSQLGRRRRKLERDHGLAFRCTETAAELEADLDAFLDLHDERWGGREGRVSSQDAASRRLLRGFAAAALERGWLRLWIAEADGAPAAAWYGWRIGQRYCYALSGLRESYEKLALGTVLLAQTIEQAAAEGAQIYDLMWGDEGYKQRFETGRREAATWVLSRRFHPARPAIAAGVGGRRALAGLPPGLKRPLARAVRRS